MPARATSAHRRVSPPGEVAPSYISYLVNQKHTRKLGERENEQKDLWLELEVC